MNQVITQAIVLSRTNYQEADRILTMLTPSHGKVTAIAKGVRKSKSKLAGGVELFSVTEIGFIRGKSELVTLTSSRLLKHYDAIVQDINRTMVGYDLIKLINKVTEDDPETEYFDLLNQTYAALNEPAVHLDILKLWFYAELLRLAGHTPNLQTDGSGKQLQADASYGFDIEAMTFSPDAQGRYASDFIKFMRLVFGGHQARAIQQVQGIETLVTPSLLLVETMRRQHLHI